MQAKAREYPDWFSLHRDGNRWHWINRPLQIKRTFTFLDEADWSLDCDIVMNFFEWHAPVPLAHERQIFTRA